MTRKLHRPQVTRRKRPKFGAMKVATIVLFAGWMAGCASAQEAPWVVRPEAAEVHLAERTAPPRRVALGNEQLKELVPLLGRGGVAVVANATSVLLADVREAPTHLVDTLLGLGVNVRKVFAPEHGFRGGCGERGAHCGRARPAHGPPHRLAARRPAEAAPGRPCRCADHRV